MVTIIYQKYPWIWPSFPFNLPSMYPEKKSFHRLKTVELVKYKLLNNNESLLTSSTYSGDEIWGSQFIYPNYKRQFLVKVLRKSILATQVSRSFLPSIHSTITGIRFHRLAMIYQFVICTIRVDLWLLSILFFFSVKFLDWGWDRIFGGGCLMNGPGTILQ